MSYGQVIINLFGGRSPLCFTVPSDVLIQQVKAEVELRTAIPIAEQRFTTLGGKPFEDNASVFQGSNNEFVTLNLNLGLLGGKGGFGSMLRAQGGKMASQKTTNFEACRDLNGRRLRTIKEAKRLADYLEKEPERKRAREEKIRKKIDEGLQEHPAKKSRFDDNKYLRDSQEIIENVKNTVAEVMKSKKSASQSSKKQTISALTMWDDVSDDASDDSSDDASDDAAGNDVSGNGVSDEVSADESEAETSCSDYSNSRESSSE